MNANIRRILIFSFAVAIWFTYSWLTKDPEPTSAPENPQPPGPQFVGSASCAECHADETKAWTGSHHDRAMETPDAVLGDFDDATRGDNGFFRRDGKPFVRTGGKEYEVKATFGFDPLQQVLLETERGRWQAFTDAWDVNQKRWFPLQEEQLPEGDALSWKGQQYNWNSNCADCHSTGLQRNFNVRTLEYDTKWAEIDVACEACHGPGSDHVKSAGKTRFPQSDEVESCARCHSRRSILQEQHEQGAPFLDQYEIALLREGLYHADGQIDDEVFVYGSFLQSKMHAQGVKCSDCHDPHTAQLKRPENETCTQCHSPNADERFPTLKKKLYDDAAHHFHPEGAQCVDCHMPSKTYMVVDPRRDHSFRVPRPDLTAKIGTPNACNDCHPDKPPEWAHQVISEHNPDAVFPKHFGETIHAARTGAEGANEAIEDLVMDEAQPPIVRATAVSLLNRPLVLGDALRDESALVRGTAAAMSRSLLGRVERLRRVRPLLLDPVRWVRIEAANALSPVQELWRDGPFRDALGEFLERQQAIADRAESHLNVGVLANVFGDPSQAEASYKKAIELDANFLPARFNLAMLYNAHGRNGDALRTLIELVRIAPENGEARYSLALLLAEEKKYTDAIAHFEEAIKRLPDRRRIRFNYALALQTIGRVKEARRQLQRLVRAEPTNAEFAQALAALR